MASRDSAPRFFVANAASLLLHHVQAPCSKSLLLCMCALQCYTYAPSKFIVIISSSCWLHYGRGMDTDQQSRSAPQ